MTTNPSDPVERLSDAQWDLLTGWFGDFTVAADHSWPLQTTAVFELDTVDGPMIVKASTGDLMDNHMVREIRAHREILGSLDGFPELVYADPDARLLVTRYLPGVIAEDSTWADHAGVFEEAGRLISRLHSARDPVVSSDYLDGAVEKTRHLLDRGRDLIEDHPAVLRILEGVETGPVGVVPTHGDFQPRNWLVDPGVDDVDGTPRTSLIDFGRFDYRPWYSDLFRLHHQVFADRPDLAAALYRGAGWNFPDPIPARDRSGWIIENLLNSVGTIVWASGIGDLTFADQGRGMLERTLDDFPPA